MKVIFAFTALFLSTLFFFPFADGWCWDDSRWKEQHEFNMKMNDPQEFQKRRLELDKQRQQMGLGSPPPTQLRQSPGAINSRTGEYYPGVVGGSVNPRTGEFYPSVGQ